MPVRKTCRGSTPQETRHYRRRTGHEPAEQHRPGKAVVITVHTYSGECVSAANVFHAAAKRGLPCLHRKTHTRTGKYTSRGTAGKGKRPQTDVRQAEKTAKTRRLRISPERCAALRPEMLRQKHYSRPETTDTGHNRHLKPEVSEARGAGSRRHRHRPQPHRAQSPRQAHCTPSAPVCFSA